jgi:hypothetical protein
MKTRNAEDTKRAENTERNREKVLSIPLFSSVLSALSASSALNPVSFYRFCGAGVWSESENVTSERELTFKYT